ncbi:hypothetical protein K504DRAFT_512184 [Pleomassaria siparia CBS 279.74]|uniref:Uncharacterized protein n=1 Tax=Pleomassaria siparia CBS 279.74 TaxID=1314801 RepID=A0A6G1K3U1_9PLEO|nr:hypothetical protein K504DRAFT_512184 [Pleomassaria siparia CBS 279.74]
MPLDRTMLDNTPLFITYETERMFFDYEIRSTFSLVAEAIPRASTSSWYLFRTLRLIINQQLPDHLGVGHLKGNVWDVIEIGNIDEQITCLAVFHTTAGIRRHWDFIQVHSSVMSKGFKTSSFSMETMFSFLDGDDSDDPQDATSGLGRSALQALTAIDLA